MLSIEPEINLRALLREALEQTGCDVVATASSDRGLQTADVALP